MDIAIREATDQETPAILALNRAAFGEEEGPEIVALLEALLPDPPARPLLSLVAEARGEVVGHILFTAARVEGAREIISRSEQAWSVFLHVPWVMVMATKCGWEVGAS